MWRKGTQPRGAPRAFRARRDTRDTNRTL